MMKRLAVLLCFFALSGYALAQGPRPGDLGASKLDLGEPGIHWYTTWESAEAEAIRDSMPRRLGRVLTRLYSYAERSVRVPRFY